MRFSSRTGRWVGKTRRSDGYLPDPYGPNSPDFAERHREHVTTLPGGLVRIDLGQPVGPRQPSRKAPKQVRQAPVANAPMPPPPPSAPSPSPWRAIDEAEQTRARKE